MSNSLKINVLGEISVFREGQRLELPPSKKCRGLLAYLVVTGRSHRRERLCQLLWDVADDPRGALRWTLSKLRPLVDAPGAARLVADRVSVHFESHAAQVDLLQVQEAWRQDLDALSTESLDRLARLFRGEFLEGLDLSDYHDFQAWCIGVREEARKMQIRVLQLLLGRLAGSPEEALQHARVLVACDSLDDHARAALVELLARTGHPQEARQHLEAGRRLLREMERSGSEALDRAERLLAERKPAPAVAEPETLVVRPETTAAVTSLVGRHQERQALRDAVEQAAAARRQGVLLIRGEPGVGKTRLLLEARSIVEARRGTVLWGQSFEAEAHRAYGPWIDAITALHPSSVGTTLAPQLAPLLPGGDLEQEGRSRERFFAAAVELLASRAHSAPPVLLTFDDVQWCDEASAELLHYVVRMLRHRPLLVLLAARDGELPDNEAIQRLLRGLRRDAMLQDLAILPLGREETLELVHIVAPQADGKRIFHESAGNPLYAIEYARSYGRAQDPVPKSLAELVQDRLQRLSPEAEEALQWATIVGGAVPVTLLESLMPDGNATLDALESLERHGLLRPAGPVTHRGPAYVFAHDLVRRVVDAGVSEPRRRLMHGRVAEIYRRRLVSDPASAVELARHAARAGDLVTAAESCIAAGRHCLRIFANGDAWRLGRKAFRYAESLDAAPRLQRQIEACEVQLAARRPRDVEAEASRLESLAEAAYQLGCVEHARLGFHLVSYLRWEKGDWTAARAQTLRAEQVSRGGADREQVVAMAEAARCLALLERDLVDAEALVLEARSRARRSGLESMAILDALGMLRCHHGEWDEAAALFREARELSRRQGDRMGEFQVLEHLTMLELERGDVVAASASGQELLKIAAKLREGSDEPCARALASLAALRCGEDAWEALEVAMASLRAADAKYRLAFTLTRAAEVDLERGEASRARQRAEEALLAATAVDHPTEMAMARVVLAQVAWQTGQRQVCRDELGALHALLQRGGTAHARRKAEALMQECGDAMRDDLDATGGAA